MVANKCEYGNNRIGIQLYLSELKRKSMKDIITWGGILGLLLVILSLGLYLLDMSESGWTSISYLIIIGVISIGVFKFRETNGGYLPYGSGLLAGTKIAFFGSVIAGVYTYLHLTQVDPDFIDRLLYKIEDQLYEAGVAGVNDMMDFYRRLFKPLPFAIWSSLGTTFVGFIVSLIVAAIVQKKDTSFEANFK